MELNDSPEVLERIKAELSLVDDIARAIYLAIAKAVEIEELTSAGREGLLDAARRFDPDHGIPFRAYAALRIRGSIWDSARRNNKLPRRIWSRIVAEQATTHLALAEAPYAAAEPPTQDETTTARNLDSHLAAAAMASALSLAREAAESLSPAQRAPEDPETALANAQLLSLVRDALGRLGQREAEIVRLRYEEDQSFVAIAKTMGVDQSWTNRLHRRAMGELGRGVRKRI